MIHSYRPTSEPEHEDPPAPYEFADLTPEAQDEVRLAYHVMPEREADLFVEQLFRELYPPLDPPDEPF